MSLTYTTFIQQLFNLIAANSTANGATTTDPNLLIEVPGIIDYGEQRLYRELDLIGTRITDTTATLTVQQRTMALPTTFGNFLVVEEVSVISPSSATFANGTRNPLVPISKQFIDAVYPSVLSPNGIPEYFAVLDSSTILIGQAPDQPYKVEVMGTQRPTPLSSANATTILTTLLPDLFMAACMVKASGYMREFSAQADNPQMAQAWESQYNILKQSALLEEVRKKYQSQGWTNELASPSATPPRV